jgi:L-fuconolactonase
MQALGALPNVSCKVSGLAVARSADLAPFVKRVIDWFGEDRLLFGSDWPVCLLAASYEEIMERFHALTRDLSRTAQARVLGENALTIYR